MPDKYYIETSIPSFYYDTRNNIRAQAMRKWTRQWWHHMPGENMVLLTGLPVMAELSRAPDKYPICEKLSHKLSWSHHGTEQT